MNEPESADSSNLTGVWDGIFQQPGQQGQVSFTATLIDTGSLLTGSTHEACSVPECPLNRHFATVSGERAGKAVSFTKCYDPPGFGYNVVHYAGTLSADGSEIAGRWTIAQAGLSGEFLMVRAQRKSAERVRKKDRAAAA